MPTVCTNDMEMHYDKVDGMSYMACHEIAAVRMLVHSTDEAMCLPKFLFHIRHPRFSAKTSVFRFRLIDLAINT